MTILSISEQSTLFLSTVVLGVITGFLYDVFRILRRTFKHPDFLTHIEDFLYWVIVTLVIFYFLLNKNYGEIRFYSIFGEFLGMGLYFLTISKFVMLVSMTVVNFLKQVIFTLIKLIWFPIGLILRLFIRPARFAKKSAKKVLQKTGSYAKIKSRQTKRNFKLFYKMLFKKLF